MTQLLVFPFSHTVFSFLDFSNIRKPQKKKSARIPPHEFSAIGVRSASLLLANDHDINANPGVQGCKHAELGDSAGNPVTGRARQRGRLHLKKYTRVYLCVHCIAGYYTEIH